MSDIRDQLLGAMESIAGQVVNATPIDRTVTAQIVKVMDVGVGKYRVRHNGNTMFAYSLDPMTVYRVGEEIYMLVPQGDFARKKMIIGRAAFGEGTRFSDRHQMLNQWRRHGPDWLSDQWYWRKKDAAGDDVVRFDERSGGIVIVNNASQIRFPGTDLPITLHGNNFVEVQGPTTITNSIGTAIGRFVVAAVMIRTPLSAVTVTDGWSELGRLDTPGDSDAIVVYGKRATAATESFTISSSSTVGRLGLRLMDFSHEFVVVGSWTAIQQGNTAAGRTFTPPARPADTRALHIMASRETGTNIWSTNPTTNITRVGASAGNTLGSMMATFYDDGSGPASRTFTRTTTGWEGTFLALHIQRVSETPVELEAFYRDYLFERDPSWESTPPRHPDTELTPTELARTNLPPHMSYDDTRRIDSLFGHASDRRDWFEVSATFQTQFSSPRTSGDYGLLIECLVDEARWDTSTDTPTPGQGATRPTQLATFKMSCKGFNGNPYALTTPTPQKQVFSFPRGTLRGLVRVSLYQEGFEADIVPYYNTNPTSPGVSYEVNPINPEGPDDDTPWPFARRQTRRNNILVSDVQIHFVEQVNLANRLFWVQIDTPNGTDIWDSQSRWHDTSRETPTPENPEALLRARLFYGANELTSEETCKFYWYREKIDANSDHASGGPDVNDRDEFGRNWHDNLRGDGEGEGDGWAPIAWNIPNDNNRVGIAFAARRQQAGQPRAGRGVDSFAFGQWYAGNGNPDTLAEPISNAAPTGEDSTGPGTLRNRNYVLPIFNTTETANGIHGRYRPTNPRRNVAYNELRVPVDQVPWQWIYRVVVVYCGDTGEEGETNRDVLGRRGTLISGDIVIRNIGSPFNFEMPTPQIGMGMANTFARLRNINMPWVEYPMFDESSPAHHGADWWARWWFTANGSTNVIRGTVQAVEEYNQAVDEINPTTTNAQYRAGRIRINDLLHTKAMQLTAQVYLPVGGSVARLPEDAGIITRVTVADHLEQPIIGAETVIPTGTTGQGRERTVILEGVQLVRENIQVRATFADLTSRPEVNISNATVNAAGTRAVVRLRFGNVNDETMYTLRARTINPETIWMSASTAVVVGGDTGPPAVTTVVVAGTPTAGVITIPFNDLNRERVVTVTGRRLTAENVNLQVDTVNNPITPPTSTHTAINVSPPIIADGGTTATFGVTFPNPAGSTSNWRLAARIRTEAGVLANATVAVEARPDSRLDTVTLEGPTTMGPDEMDRGRRITVTGENLFQGDLQILLTRSTGAIVPEQTNEVVLNIDANRETAWADVIFPESAATSLTYRAAARVGEATWRHNPPEQNVTLPPVPTITAIGNFTTAGAIGPGATGANRNRTVTITGTLLNDHNNPNIEVRAFAISQLDANLPIWSAGTTYPRGTVVVRGLNRWRATGDPSGAQPPDDRFAPSDEWISEGIITPLNGIDMIPATQNTGGTVTSRTFTIAFPPAINDVVNYRCEARVIVPMRDWIRGTNNQIVQALAMSITSVLQFPPESGRDIDFDSDNRVRIMTVRGINLFTNPAAPNAADRGLRAIGGSATNSQTGFDWVHQGVITISPDRTTAWITMHFGFPTIASGTQNWTNVFLRAANGDTFFATAATEPNIRVRQVIVNTVQPNPHPVVLPDVLQSHSGAQRSRTLVVNGQGLIMGRPPETPGTAGVGSTVIGMVALNTTPGTDVNEISRSLITPNDQSRVELTAQIPVNTGTTDVTYRLRVRATNESAWRDATVIARGTAFTGASTPVAPMTMSLRGRTVEPEEEEVEVIPYCLPTDVPTEQAKKYVCDEGNPKYDRCSVNFPVFVSSVQPENKALPRITKFSTAEEVYKTPVILNSFEPSVELAALEMPTMSIAPMSAAAERPIPPAFNTFPTTENPGSNSVENQANVNLIEIANVFTHLTCPEGFPFNIDIIGRTHFNYFANGRIKRESALNEVNSLQARIRWNGPFIGEYSVQWAFPPFVDGPPQSIEDMQTDVMQNSENAGISYDNSMLYGIWVRGMEAGNNANVARFRIRELLDRSLTNNSLFLKINFITEDGWQEYIREVPITFTKDGDPGTNGRDWSARVHPVNTTPAEDQVIGNPFTVRQKIRPLHLTGTLAAPTVFTGSARLVLRPFIEKLGRPLEQITEYFARITWDVRYGGTGAWDRDECDIVRNDLMQRLATNSFIRVSSGAEGFLTPDVTAETFFRGGVINPFEAAAVQVTWHGPSTINGVSISQVHHACVVRAKIDIFEGDFANGVDGAEHLETIFDYHPVDILITPARNPKWVDFRLIDTNWPSIVQYDAVGYNPQVLFESGDPLRFRYGRNRMNIAPPLPDNAVPVFSNAELGTIRQTVAGEFQFDPTSYYVANSWLYASIRTMVAGLDDFADWRQGAGSIFIRPIIYRLMTHGNADINGWDGRVLVPGITDNYTPGRHGEGAILAPTVGAGWMHPQTNKFTGVIMGQNTALSRPSYTNSRGGFPGEVNNSRAGKAYMIGLFGYQNGLSSFGILENGTAYFGRADRSRIYFDGVNAQISGGKMTGNQRRNPSGADCMANRMRISLIDFHAPGNFNAVSEAIGAPLEQSNRIYSGPNADAGQNLEDIMPPNKCGNLVIQTRPLMVDPRLHRFFSWAQPDAFGANRTGFGTGPGFATPAIEIGEYDPADIERMIVPLTVCDMRGTHRVGDITRINIPGNRRFLVTYDGTMYAMNAFIKGNIIGSNIIGSQFFNANGTFAVTSNGSLGIGRGPNWMVRRINSSGNRHRNTWSTGREAGESYTPTLGEEFRVSTLLDPIGRADFEAADCSLDESSTPPEDGPDSGFAFFVSPRGTVLANDLHLRGGTLNIGSFHIIGPHDGAHGSQVGESTLGTGDVVSYGCMYIIGGRTHNAGTPPGRNDNAIEGWGNLYLRGKLSNLGDVYLGSAVEKRIGFQSNAANSRNSPFAICPRAGNTGVVTNEPVLPVHMGMWPLYFFNGARAFDPPTTPGAEGANAAWVCLSSRPRANTPGNTTHRNEFMPGFGNRAARNYLGTDATIPDLPQHVNWRVDQIGMWSDAIILTNRDWWGDAAARNRVDDQPMSMNTHGIGYLGWYNGRRGTATTASLALKSLAHISPSVIIESPQITRMSAGRREESRGHTGSPVNLGLAHANQAIVEAWRPVATGGEHNRDTILLLRSRLSSGTLAGGTAVVAVRGSAALPGTVGLAVQSDTDAEEAVFSMNSIGFSGNVVNDDFGEPITRLPLSMDDIPRRRGQIWLRGRAVSLDTVRDLADVPTSGTINARVRVGRDGSGLMIDGHVAAFGAVANEGGSGAVLMTGDRHLIANFERQIMMRARGSGADNWITLFSEGRVMIRAMNTAASNQVGILSHGAINLTARPDQEPTAGGTGDLRVSLLRDFNMDMDRDFMGIIRRNWDFTINGNIHFRGSNSTVWTVHNIDPERQIGIYARFAP